VTLSGCASSAQVGGSQDATASSTQGDADAGSDRTTPAVVTSGQAHTVAVHDGDTVRGLIEIEIWLRPVS
jgi:hypothetical protein